MLREHKVLSQLVNVTDEGLIVTDDNAKILTCNNGAKKILGIETKQHLMGKKITYFLRDNSEDIHDLNYYLEFSSKGSKSVTLINSSNEEVPVLMQVSLIEAEDEDKTPMYVWQLTNLKAFIDNRELTQAKNNELNKLTENIPGMVFCCTYNRKRPIEFISPNITKLAGYNVDDFTSGKVLYKDLMSAEDEKLVWNSIGQSLKTEKSYAVEYRLIHKDGHSIWVSENGRVVVDEDGMPQSIVGSIADNTVVKKRSAEFEGTVSALNRATAVIEFDLKGRILDANNIFLGLMGYQLEEVVGHHHRMFCSAELSSSQEYKEFWKKLQSGQVDSGEYVRVNKNGEETWIQATYNPIFDADGKPYKVMKFATDLSQRQAMEKELRIAMGKAEEAMDAKGNFLANMSHEIRTPMNAIIGFTEILLKTELDKQQRHHASIVLNTSHSLLRLLNEILDMAKLEKGAVEIEKRNFNFRFLVEQVIESLRVQAEQKGIDLKLDLDNDMPDFLNSDSLRIQQILLNLLSNAIKFTEKGSVTLKVRYADGFLTSSVIDTGIGMDKAYLKTIFDPFTQSDVSTSRKFGGTGLGTSICQKLTKLMDGHIDVESELGEGTVFTVTLPAEVGTREEKVATKKVEIKPLNILVAEDTPESLQLLTIVLEDHGHTITATHDGKELVEAYQHNINAKEKAFDIVITDLQMPRMNGLEACQAIREFEIEQNVSPIPMIALSANVLEEHRQLANKVGMNGFVFKPLQEEELIKGMAKALELKEKHDDLQVSHSEPREDFDSVKKFQEELAKHELIAWEQGIKLWKKEAVLIDSIKNFMEQNEQLQSNLSRALSEKRYQDIVQLSHKARGASCNLGLNRMHFVTSNIENAAHKKDTISLTEWTEKLSTVMVLTEQQLTQKIASNKPVKKQKIKATAKLLSSEDVVKVIEQLDVLEKALSANSVNDTALEALLALVNDQMTNELQKRINNFDFEGSLSQLNVLKDKYSLLIKDCQEKDDTHGAI